MLAAAVDEGDQGQLGVCQQVHHRSLPRFDSLSFPGNKLRIIDACLPTLAQLAVELFQLLAQLITLFAEVVSLAQLSLFIGERLARFGELAGLELGLHRFPAA